MMIFFQGRMCRNSIYIVKSDILWERPIAGFALQICTNAIMPGNRCSIARECNVTCVCFQCQSKARPLNVKLHRSCLRAMF
eukprot:scaffold69206_cov23-Prasinocladus_malaysianus.AAC.1